MREPRELTIREAAKRMKAGKLTAEKLIESCLERIHEREETIHAWVEVYEQQALAEARRCDDEMQKGNPRGPLHGIPLGVKDIIDVRGQYTRCGTPVYPATVPREDAMVIARLRKCRGDLFRQDGNDPVRQQRSHNHQESLESGAYTGRIKQRLRRRGGGPDVSGGPGHPDGWLAPPAGRLQWNRRL